MQPFTSQTPSVRDPKLVEAGITIDHLEQSQIAIPPDDLTKAFEDNTKPIIDRMVKAHEETQELTALRDWLLPMLMNGQVTVG